MGQREVLKVLKRNKHRWLLKSEIHERIGGDKSNVSKCLRQLRKYGEVQAEYENGKFRYQLES